jgi:hypothetical protein
MRGIVIFRTILAKSSRNRFCCWIRVCLSDDKNRTGDFIDSRLSIRYKKDIMFVWIRVYLSDTKGHDVFIDSGLSNVYPMIKIGHDVCIDSRLSIRYKKDMMFL